MYPPSVERRNNKTKKGRGGRWTFALLPSWRERSFLRRSSNTLLVCLYNRLTSIVLGCLSRSDASEGRDLCVLPCVCVCSLMFFAHSSVYPLLCLCQLDGYQKLFHHTSLHFKKKNWSLTLRHSIPNQIPLIFMKKQSLKWRNKRKTSCWCRYSADVAAMAVSLRQNEDSTFSVKGKVKYGISLCFTHCS